jgi:hypothetical protein
MTFLLKYTDKNQKEAFRYLISKKYLKAKIVSKTDETFYMFDMYTLDTPEKRKTFSNWLNKNNITSFTSIQKPELYINKCIEDGADVIYSTYN